MTPYYLSNKTKTMIFCNASQDELIEADADCQCCIQHYPEDQDEVELAFSIQRLIYLELVNRRGFFGDHQ